MSRRKSPNPKKVFWIILGLSALVVVGAAVTTAILGSPQASTDTINVDKLQGAIIYPVDSTPTTETVKLVRVVTNGAGGENVIADNIAISQTDNAKIDRKPNRTFSVTSSTVPTLKIGDTYRFKLANGCYSEFKVPSLDKLTLKNKIAVLDRRFMPDTPVGFTFYRELDRIDYACAGSPTPTPSPSVSPSTSPTPTATPTPTPTPSSTTSTLPTATSTTTASSTPAGGDPVAVPIRPVFCSDKSPKLDVIFVADASGSMDDSAAGNLMKSFVARMVNQNKLRPATDRGSLITFSNPTVVRIEFTTDYASIKERVNAMTFGADASNITAGVLKASDLVRGSTRQSPQVPVVVVMMSDNQSEMTAQARTIADQDATRYLSRYFAVSFAGRNPRLVELARAGQGSYMNVANSGQVNTAVDSLMSRIDSLVEGCTSLELAVAPKTVKVGQTTEATFTLKNFTRNNLTNSTLTQLLPTGLQTEDNRSRVSLTIPLINSGQTLTQKINLKGAN